MQAGRIENGVIVDLHPIPPSRLEVVTKDDFSEVQVVPVTIADMFHPEAGFVEVPDGAKVGMTWDGSKLAERSAPALDVNAAIARVRRQRDAKLAASDWSQLQDVPKSVAEKWQTYRQALRDLPKDLDVTKEISWPEEPK